MLVIHVRLGKDAKMQCAMCSGLEMTHAVILDSIKWKSLLPLLFLDSKASFYKLYGRSRLLCAFNCNRWRVALTQKNLWKENIRYIK